MLFPYKGNRLKVSQPYWLGIHNGIDLVGVDSKEICAICPGTVTVAKYHNSMGNYVRIQQTDGLYSTYMHLAEFKVAVGDGVSAGDVIGTEGSTGNSTGSHLHLQVENQGNIIHTNECPYVIDVAEYTGIPNDKGYYERKDIDMTREETSIMITDALRRNNEELIAIVDRKLSEQKEKIYHYEKDIPDWAYDDVKYLMDKGVFFGKAADDLNLSQAKLEMLCLIARALRLSKNN